MTFRRLLSLALRESRFSRRRLFLFLSAISLGVAALVAVQGFASTMQREVREQARAMLGADMQLSSREPFGPRSSELLAEFAAQGIAIARVTSFTSMARHTGGGATRFVQVRAVEPGFPFYGTIETSPPGRWEALHDGRNAIVDPALLVALDAEIGDTISIGEAELTIIGTLERLPGDIEIASSFAPRVFMPAAYLDETGLLGFGSRGEYDAFLKVDDLELAELIDDRYRPVWRAERVRSRTLREQQEQMDEVLGSLGRYLGLVGVFALLLGGIGVASAMSAYMSRKVDGIAVLRCIGATSGQVFAIYLLQAAVMGLAGAAFGVALGAAAQWLLPQMLTGLLPVDVPVRVDVPAAAGGLLVGMWAALAFALLPLLDVRRVSPLSALRRRVEPLPRGPRDLVRTGAWAALIASVLLLIVYQAQSVGVGLAMAAGIGATLLVLWLAARIAARSLRAAPRGALPYTARQGIANLYRPGNQTVTVVLALGFGAFLIATLILTQANILRPLAVNTETRFNLILLDVQADQVEPVERILARRGIDVLESVPLVSMRVAAVKGEPVRPVNVTLDSPEDGRETERGRGDGPRGWAVRREYRSTFRNVLSDSERLVAGKWWGNGAAGEGAPLAGAAADPKAAPYEVSLEQEIAEELGVGVGDRIDWDVQGVIVPTVVTSIRAVDWARLEPNFFAVFEPAALEAAPQMWVLLAHGEDADARALAQRDVVAEHSNISAIDLTLVQAALDEVIGRVSVVIRFLAGFSVATGFVVLLGAVATGRLQRIRESVLLKTLGATRRQIGAILLAEYAALGLLAAIVGAGLSLAAAWALARYLFDVPFAAEPVTLVALAAGVAALSAVIGLSGSREVFRSTPMEALREE
ncbi:MAG TPA: FtsX-like permease family protein [Gammaproteobacteria bacterium]